MGLFSIEVLPEQGMWNKKTFQCGRITIGSFSERLALTLDSWSIEDYKKQWHEGIERLKTHNASCLVTTADNMSKRPSLWIWVLYKLEEIVYIRNRLLDDRTIAGLDNKPVRVLTTDNFYNYILPRRIYNDEGQKISEWSVPLADVLAFKVV